MNERRIVFTTVHEGVVDREGRTVEVVVIRPGLSNNGHRYDEAVLRESVLLWDGAAAFCDHPGLLDQGRAGGRSVRDLVGVYEGARYEDGRGVIARLRLYPTAGWLGDIVEQHLADEAAGRPVARLGISADMIVVKEAARGNGVRPTWDVRRIVRVNSGDVVVNPSAGGRFERILEGEEDRKGEETVEAAENRPEIGAGNGQEVERLREALRREVLEAKLAAARLPEKARAHLRTTLAGQVFEAAEMDRAIESMRTALGEVAAPGVVAGAGGGRPAVVTGTPRDRVQVALDRLFGIEPPDSLRDTPRFSGIREAYIAITGDRMLTGRPSFAESVLEANEVTTTVLADTLLDSMTKRLTRDYQAQPRWWEPVTARVSLNNMRTQQRVLLGDFAGLSDVEELGAYTNLAWSDTKETYTPAKKGNTVQVSLETIINDDLRAITHIPAKLARAAAVTLNEFVAGLFTANSGIGPAMADTYNVFEAAHHANTGTSALAEATLEAAMIAIAKQTSSASKRLGLMGRWLLVPPEIMYTAMRLCQTPQKPGSPNNDINPFYNRIEPIVVPNWTDANNWYLMADPGQVECLELGFLNGKEEPELLVQDSPAVGSVFTNDAITFKVRWVFGGGWLDHRGAYGAIVA